ncbi:MAG: hypothetical protein BGO14_07630 [Chlamydiales bacterium 38-26]|nr:hypothetical protein [Chlamydiales bacterium]OJV10870.1 MAG: hypothetical protein BGO14_07630 [Chlamydiales bacterium 38-26]
MKLPSIEIYPTFKAEDAQQVRNRTMQRINQSSSERDPVFEEFRENPLDRTMKRDLKNWKKCLKNSKDFIERHLEQRFYQVFIQAVLCWKTHYIFSIGKTLHQGFSARQICDKKDVLCAFHAAHSATIPCLYAQTKEEETNVYLYASGFYDESNQTQEILKEVNEADLEIDERRTDSLLREKTLALLNDVSSEEYSPVEALHKFAESCLEEIEKASARDSISDKIKDVLEIYHNKTLELIDFMGDPKNLDLLLNVQNKYRLLDKSEAVLENLKQGEYVKQKKILALLARKIRDLPVEILSANRLKPHYMNAFNRLYYYEIFKRFEGVNLRYLEKAVGIKFKALKAQVGELSNSEKGRNVLEQEKNKIKRLVKQLSTILYALSGEDYKHEDLKGLSLQKWDCLRPILYQSRYRIILEDQKTQSIIKSKLESVYYKILDPEKCGDRYKETFFYYEVFKMFNNETRIHLCKLLNISYTQLNQTVREIRVNQKLHIFLQKYVEEIQSISKSIAKKSKIVRVQKKLQALVEKLKDEGATAMGEYLVYARLYDAADDDEEEEMIEQIIGWDKQALNKEIKKAFKSRKIDERFEKFPKTLKNLKDVVCKNIEHLEECLNEFQGHLLRELRLIHGMGKENFRETYEKQFAKSLDTSKIRSLERGEIAFEEDFVHEISKIFGVSEELFHPGLFIEK